MPIEHIYGEYAATQQYKDYVYQGMLMEVKPLMSGQALIIRLINPPLDCYLQPEYAPGAIIPYTPNTHNI